MEKLKVTDVKEFAITKEEVTKSIINRIANEVRIGLKLLEKDLYITNDNVVNFKYSFNDLVTHAEQSHNCKYSFSGKKHLKFAINLNEKTFIDAIDYLEKYTYLVNFYVKEITKRIAGEMT